MLGRFSLKSVSQSAKFDKVAQKLHRDEELSYFVYQQVDRDPMCCSDLRWLPNVEMERN